MGSVHNYSGEELPVEAVVTATPLRPVLLETRASFRPWLALTSIAAIICLSLEMEVLEQLDSLTLYMTYREIALDVGVALLVLLGLAVTWWAFTLLAVGIAKLIPSADKYSTLLGWRLGLGIPLSYLVLDIFAAIRLELFPNWHPGLFGWVLLNAAFAGVGIGSLCVITVPKLQEFCRTRLAPIGWFHIALGLVALISLRVGGVYLFRDYARPGTSTAASGLPDIYLITMDALRAEDTSLYGYYRPTTPNLERFAQRSFTFDYFFSNSNFTTPTTTSIETGELPWSHRVFQVGGFPSVKAQHETLASVLRQRGYYTAMISSNYLASPAHHRTLESYDAVEYAAPIDGSGPWLRYTNLIGANTQHTLFASLLQRLGGIRFYLDALIWRNSYPYPAEPVFDRARSLLERRDIAQPRFVWTHIFAPHDPYLPPAPYRSRFLSSSKLMHGGDFLGFRNTTLPRGVSVSDMRARYDEMILYADRAVGDYLDWLDQTGRLDRSIVIISADHGESFEHKWLLHSGPYLHNGLIHIPLLIHLPGQRQSARVNQPAQQVDLLPTVLDLVGSEVPAWTDGTSLKPALERSELPRRFVYSMNLEPNKATSPVSKGTVAVIDSEYKYVYQLSGQHGSLYRYRTDQLEEHDLADTEPGVAAHMRSVLFDKLREVNQHSTAKP